MVQASRDVLSEFTHLRDVAMQVAEMIAEVRTRFGAFEDASNNIELEVRLGNLFNTHFEPNVGRTTFCGILQLLESYPRWSRVTGWQETQDVFYTADLPATFTGESPRKLRSRG